MPNDMQPFRLQVPQDEIDDLRSRLARSRFPDAVLADGWQLGTDLAWLSKLIGYWRTDFDWRTQEQRLNGFPQFRTQIDGVPIHFLHVKGTASHPIPLLLCHGWPGSVFEFLDIIPRLTQNSGEGGGTGPSFSVVVPSLPGFGLSSSAGQRPVGPRETAQLFHRLMQELGYASYGVQGGDLGSFIACDLAQFYPQSVSGIHLNFLPVRLDAEARESSSTKEHRQFFSELDQWRKNGSGYSVIQGTRPQSLGLALTDSPAGLAAWIAEKFQAWSDCDRDPDQVIGVDQMLGNISFYWFTKTIMSSFWPYHERYLTGWPITSEIAIEVPMGYAAFPKEVMRPPKALADRTYRQIKRWTKMERGGHFAAMEQPAALAEEIKRFFQIC